MQMTWFITGSSRGFGREIAKAALEDAEIESSPRLESRISSTIC